MKRKLHFTLAGIRFLAGILACSTLGSRLTADCCRRKAGWSRSRSDEKSKIGKERKVFGNTGARWHESEESSIPYK